MGEGCYGRGAQTRSPGGCGGRGSAAARQLSVPVPFPLPRRSPVRMPWRRAEHVRLYGVQIPLGIVVRSQSLILYGPVIGPHFPEVPGPNWGVPEC